MPTKQRDETAGLILLVEDNRGIAEMVGEFLERRGYSLDYASDGVTGLRLATTNSYDVVVSPECPNVAAELAAYQYKVLRSGVKTSDPLDEDNHALDGVRYSLSEYEPSQSNRKGSVVWL